MIFNSCERPAHTCSTGNDPSILLCNCGLPKDICRIKTNALESITFQLKQKQTRKIKEIADEKKRQILQQCQNFIADIEKSCMDCIKDVNDLIKGSQNNTEKSPYSNGNLDETVGKLDKICMKKELKLKGWKIQEMGKERKKLRNYLYTILAAIFFFILFKTINKNEPIYQFEKFDLSLLETNKYMDFEIGIK